MSARIPTPTKYGHPPRRRFHVFATIPSRLAASARCRYSSHFFFGGSIRAPFLPVDGFVFPFVDQLLLAFLSGVDRFAAATCVPSFFVYARTCVDCDLAPVPGPADEE